jgi:hypothetical protein
MRASDLLGRPVLDAAGRPLGKVVDVLARTGAGDLPAVTAVLVGRRHRGRLLGYERPGIQGPWLLERLADHLQGGLREIPLHELDLGADDGAPGARSRPVRWRRTA